MITRRLKIKIPAVAIAMVVISAFLMTACLGSEDGDTGPVDSSSDLIPIESNQAISDNEAPQFPLSQIALSQIAVPGSCDASVPESEQFPTAFPREDSGVPGSPTTAQDEATPSQSSKAVEVNARQFRQLLPRDAIAPIYTPQFLPPRAADLSPEELVIGVSIGSESKAYPIGPLARREIGQ